MTHDKRYELICNMIRAYGAESSDPAYFADRAQRVIENPRNYVSWATIPFYADAAELLVEALEGMDKATTPASALAAMKRIYKGCSDSRPMLKGLFKSGDRWALCDGYRFIRVSSKPESIPEASTMPGGEEPINLDKCIPDESRYSEAVTVPTAAEIRAFMAANKIKSGRGVTYNAMEALPGWWCNPAYLLDAVQALPGAIFHKPKSHYSPLYFESETGDGMLLPVRHQEVGRAAA